MLRYICLLATIGLLPLSSCARPSYAGEASSLHPAVSSEDTVFGSVILSEAGEWSYQDGHASGAGLT